MADVQLDGYVEVHDRIKAFYAEYPEGRLRGTWEIRHVPYDSYVHKEEKREGGKATFVVYKAMAYKEPEDKLPGIGYAWEPFPGRTPYTHGSELMNAETSAWGRAIASLGFEVSSGVASAAEVRNAEGGGGGTPSVGFASSKQEDYLRNLLSKAGAKSETVDRICRYADATMAGGRGGDIGEAIDGLKAGNKAIAKILNDEAKAWEPKQSDVPGDASDLPEASQETLSEADVSEDEAKELLEDRAEPRDLDVASKAKAAKK